MSVVFWQILVDGFAISSLYALGAMGFALIFGVSGVLNLSHGALMVAAVVAAWAAGNDLHAGTYAGAMIGVAVGFAVTLLTYFVVVSPLQRSRKIREEEKEIFILTATLLWGIMIQELIAYFYTNNAKTVAPIVEGVMSIFGVRTPKNELFTAVICWLVIGVLWLLVNRTRAGKAVLAASMNPRGVTLLGIELSQIYIAVWAVMIVASQLVRTNGHVRPDLVLRILSPATQRWVEMFNCLVAIAFTFGMVWYGWEVVDTALLLDQRSSSDLQFPLWIYYMALPVGGGLMLLRYVVRLIRYAFLFDPATMTVGHVIAAHELSDDLILPMTE